MLQSDIDRIKDQFSRQARPRMATDTEHLLKLYDCTDINCVCITIDATDSERESQKIFGTNVFDTPFHLVHDWVDKNCEELVGKRVPIVKVRNW